MSSEMILAIVGLVVGGVGGLLVGRYFWSHESKNLRIKREVERESDQNVMLQKFQAILQKSNQEFRAILEEVFARLPPGETITVRARLSEVEQASMTAASGVTGNDAVMTPTPSSFGIGRGPGGIPGGPSGTPGPGTGGLR